MDCKSCAKRKSVVGQERKSVCSISGEPVWGFAQMGKASDRCPLLKGIEIATDGHVENQEPKEPEQTEPPVTTTEAPVTTTAAPQTTTAAPNAQAQQNNGKNNRR